MLRRLIKRLFGLLGPWCVLLLGLIATAYGSRIAIEAGNDEKRDAVALNADRMVASIITRVQVHEQMLTSAAALFAASDDVSRQEWEAYLSVQRLDERWPDIVSVGFAELVEADHLAGHEASVRREGLSQYHVRPAGNRPIYLPLTYNEPSNEENRSAIGFDVYSDLVRSHAADQAIISGRPMLSGAVSTVPLLGPRLTMYAPAVRDGKLLGVAVSTLRIDLLVGMAADRSTSELSIRLYDSPIASPQAQLFDGAPGFEPDAGTISVTRAFIAGGRAWSIEAIATGRTHAPAMRSMPVLVTIAGAVIAYLGYLVASMLQRTRMSERRFRDYAEMGTDWLWEHDRELRFTFVSNTRVRRAAVAASALGKTRREIAERMSDSQEMQALEQFEAMMRAGKPFTGLEYSMRSRSGDREHFRISAKPLLGPDGEIQGYRGVTQVVTGEKRREQELRDAKSAAEAASASKSRFLAMMSHELRTPLNAIIGFSDVIAELRFGRKSIERYADYARIINRSGLQLLDLISQLLDMSKIEAGKLELLPEPVDLAEIAHDCMCLLQERAAAAGVTMHEDFATPQIRLTADRRALRQVVLNLISNAVKFTPRPGTVTISLSRDTDDAVIFRVADTGIGISSEAMSKIFIPFQQADATIARRFGGSGLGLAISRALVEAHDGTLTIASVVDQGTTATVRFPPARSLHGDAAGAATQPMLASVAD
jgi:signal transduction histidine kinase/CHASE1-domain containing sensor protein